MIVWVLYYVLLLVILIVKMYFVKMYLGVFVFFLGNIVMIVKYGVIYFNKVKYSVI